MSILRRFMGNVPRVYVGCPGMMKAAGVFVCLVTISVGSAVAGQVVDVGQIPAVAISEVKGGSPVIEPRAADWIRRMEKSTPGLRRMEILGAAGSIGRMAIVSVIPNPGTAGHALLIEAGTAAQEHQTTTGWQKVRLGITVAPDHRGPRNSQTGTAAIVGLGLHLLFR